MAAEIARREKCMVKVVELKKVLLLEVEGRVKRRLEESLVVVLA